MHTSRALKSEVSARKGFTLIELLIVIGILGILAAIVLVAVDPAKRLKQARNARRYAEVNGLLNAILNYTVDNKGTLPAAISSATQTGQVLLIGSGTATMLAMNAACPSSVTNATSSVDTVGRLGIYMVDLAKDTAFVDTYIASIPVDPKGSSTFTNENFKGTYDQTVTGYYLQRTSNGRIQVGACNAEDEGAGVVPISVKR